MCGSVRICFSFTQLPAVREDSSQFLPIAATAGNIYRRCEDRHLTANKRYSIGKTSPMLRQNYKHQF